MTSLILVLLMKFIFDQFVDDLSSIPAQDKQFVKAVATLVGAVFVILLLAVLAGDFNSGGPDAR